MRLAIILYLEKMYLESKCYNREAIILMRRKTCPMKFN